VRDKIPILKGIIVVFAVVVVITLAFLTCYFGNCYLFPIPVTHSTETFANSLAVNTIKER